MEAENIDPNHPYAHGQPHFIPGKTDYIYGPDPRRLVQEKRPRDVTNEELQIATDQELFDLFKRPPSPRLQLPDDSYFYVMVTGQVEFAENSNVDQLIVRYDFEAGNAWEPIHGLSTGSSQLACKAGGTSRKLIFNFPFEVGFRSTNPKGWPQVVFTLIGPDFMGRDVPVGYGNVHVPTTPGRHVRYVRTFVPESSSLLVRFIGWLKGRPAEYSDPARTLGSGQGREVTRVTSHGLVKVVFVIAQVNMDKFGF